MSLRFSRATALLAVLAACGPRAPALRFRPVVSEALQTGAHSVPEPPQASEADPEFVARVRTLAETLSAETGGARGLLALSARDFGDDSVPVLARMLADPGLAPALRVACAELLAAQDSAPSAHVLAFHAASNPVSWVRAQCAWRLANTTQDQVVPELIEALADERDPEARSYLAGTLAHFGCPDHATGSAPEPTASPRLELAEWREIARLGANPDPATTERVVAVLGALPTHAVRLLIEALADEDARVRAGCARALAGMGPRASAAGPALLASLIGDPAIEVEALAALGGVHHTAAEAEIERRLGERERPLAVRVAAAHALGRLEVARASAALSAACEPAEDPHLRAAAAGALCRLGRGDLGLDPLLLVLGGEAAVAARAELDGWLAEREREGNAAARKLRAEGLPADDAALRASIQSARAELLR